MSHTPGPWEIDPERPNYGRDHVNHLGFYIRSADGGGGRIAQMFENCLVTTTEEALANARVIAAAPDLLAALQSALEVHRRFMTAFPEAGESECIPAMRAAVAKALGQTKPGVSKGIEP